MQIICFEGASAVGKTTLSAYLRDKYDAFVVAEVNLLFERKSNEPKFWYFEKQIERWKLAVNAAKKHKIVILDGDPFQPLWYNWAYNYDVLESFETIYHFYRNELQKGEIAFPDKYYLLTIDKNELKKRKTNDFYRTRKNYERHLRFIEPQKAYFNYIKSLNDCLVEFVENIEIEKTGEKIINSIGGESTHSNIDSSLKLFDAIAKWLKNNVADEFVA